MADCHRDLQRETANLSCHLAYASRWGVRSLTARWPRSGTIRRVQDSKIRRRLRAMGLSAVKAGLGCCTTSLSRFLGNRQKPARKIVAAGKSASKISVAVWERGCKHEGAKKVLDTSTPVVVQETLAQGK